MTNLINGDELSDKLTKDFSSAKSIIIITAYITINAIKWLYNILEYHKNIHVTIVTRLSPNDLINGSSDIESIKEALGNGHDVFILDNLHAKIYLIDDQKLYVGSTNFTTNGLKLFGEGNLEGNIEIVPSDSDLQFVQNIIDSSIKIDLDILDRMSQCISAISSLQVNNITKWPDDILPTHNNIWVSDFPLSDPFSNESGNYGPVFDELLGIDDDITKLVAFKNTNAYKWLYRYLLDDNECYFGKLTQQLHNDLMDDPEPYRRDVKQLLSNLLSFCEYFSISEIEIDRPNYSQRISLVKH